jgi:hypothetical protein
MMNLLGSQRYCSYKEVSGQIEAPGVRRSEDRSEDLRHPTDGQGSGLAPSNDFVHLAHLRHLPVAQVRKIPHLHPRW